MRRKAKHHSRSRDGVQTGRKYLFVTSVPLHLSAHLAGLGKAVRDMVPQQIFFKMQ